MFDGYFNPPILDFAGAYYGLVAPFFLEVAALYGEALFVELEGFRDMLDFVLDVGDFLPFKALVIGFYFSKTSMCSFNFATSAVIFSISAATLSSTCFLTVSSIIYCRAILIDSGI